MVRVSVSGPVAGVKLTVVVQAAAGASVAQLVVGWKFGRVVWVRRSGVGLRRCW